MSLGKGQFGVDAKHPTYPKRTLQSGVEIETFTTSDDQSRVSVFRAHFRHIVKAAKVALKKLSKLPLGKTWCSAWSGFVLRIRTNTFHQLYEKYIKKACSTNYDAQPFFDI